MLSERVPLAVLDEFLTGGGNRDKSQLRIAAFFMSDIPEQKRSVLLAKEYDTTDIGLQIDGEKYAVYCDPHGISPIEISILISMTSHILILRNYTTERFQTQKKNWPDGSIPRKASSCTAGQSGSSMKTAWKTRN